MSWGVYTGRRNRWERSSRRVAAIVATTISSTITPCIHYRRSSRRRSPVVCTRGDCCGYRRGDDRQLVARLSYRFVAATIACSVYTGRLLRLSSRRRLPIICRDDRRDSRLVYCIGLYTTGDRRGDDRPVYTPYKSP